jgi:heptose I phosphotransferase
VILAEHRMKLMLAEPFKRLWAGRDPFAEVEALQGEVYRELEAAARCAPRSTARVFRQDPPWHRLGRDLQEPAHRQAAGARRRPGMAGHPAPAGGRRADHDRRGLRRKGSNPADQHSFIVTEELAPTVSLEDFSIDWVKQPPEPLKRALIAEVARMTGMMHRAGVNHRDCYICHFLLHTDKPVTADDFKLSVIDLHRAQTRAKITRRWRDKDLAALYFSALDIGLTRRDKLRFLKGYFQQPLRQILEEAPLLAWLKARPTSSMRANNATGMRSDGGLDTGAGIQRPGDDFGSLEAVFALQGERLTRDPLSEVIRVQRNGVNYYVKRYVGAGKGLRRYLGKPRVKMEWQNLKRFAKWGIPTAEVVAWGLERAAGLRPWRDDHPRAAAHRRPVGAGRTQRSETGRPPGSTRSAANWPATPGPCTTTALPITT